MTANTPTTVFAPAATDWCGFCQHQHGVDTRNPEYPQDGEGVTTGDMFAEGVQRIARVAPHA